MDILKMAIAAFSATNLMTTFSYILSNHYKKLFKEPVLLNYILHGAGICPKGKWATAFGWLAHYVIGIAFVCVYHAVWLYTDVDFGWISGIIFGMASGILGIICWHFVFRLPEHKPDVPLKAYYIQLFAAHIIFAVAVVVAYKLYAYDPVAKVSTIVM